MTRWICCAMVLVGALAAAGQTPEPRLIAHYPLDHDLNDATGHHGPLQAKNALLQPEKGLFCNGRYAPDNPEGCDVRTPQLSDFNPAAFTINAQFWAPRSLPYPNPVFVGGGSSRWIAYELLGDGAIRLLYNNSQRVDCKTRYRLGTWHEATITFDGKTLALYLDGVQGCHADTTLRMAQDKQLLLTNLSNSTTFHGALRDLQIYDGVVVPARRTPVADDMPDPTLQALAPVDRFLLTCPTREQLAAIDADLRLSFEADPTKGQPPACTKAGGSRDLSLLQRRIYNTLLVAKQLQFDQPLPWTRKPFYPWLVDTIKGIRFRGDVEHSACCVPARVISINVATTVMRHTDLWVDREFIGSGANGLSRFLLLVAHEARHADGASHTCGQATKDRTVDEMGSWGVQYYLARWLAEHTDQAFFSVGSLHYADDLAKEAKTILKNEFCGS
jgi:hypothetical protein